MGMPIIKLNHNICETSVGEIIESIAMEEKAIAHILNGESEKLNKIISKLTITPQQLIEVNKSVKGTLDSIIRLESILQAKLDLFQYIICKK